MDLLFSLSVFVLSDVNVAICLTKPSLGKMLSVFVYYLSGLLSVLCHCSFMLDVWEDYRQGECLSEAESRAWKQL